MCPVAFQLNLYFIKLQCFFFLFIVIVFILQIVLIIFVRLYKHFCIEPKDATNPIEVTICILCFVLKQDFVWHCKCTAWVDPNIMALLLHQASQHYSMVCLQIINSPGGSDSCLSEKEKTPDCSEMLRWGTREHGHFPAITSLPEISGRLIKETPLWLWHTPHTYVVDWPPFRCHRACVCTCVLIFICSMFTTGRGSGSRNGHVGRRTGWWHMLKSTKRRKALWVWATGFVTEESKKNPTDIKQMADICFNKRTKDSTAF